MLSWIHMLSAVVCVLLLVGVLNRSRKKIHIPLMISAVVIDLAMVLYIELNRGALASAAEKWGGLMAVHIAMSVMVLVLYGVQITTGIKKARGLATSNLHVRSMPWLLALRFGNFFTSILVMSPSMGPQDLMAG